MMRMKATARTMTVEEVRIEVSVDAMMFGEEDPIDGAETLIERYRWLATLMRCTGVDAIMVGLEMDELYDTLKSEIVVSVWEAIA